MKFISSYTFRGGCLPEAAKRFLEGKATPPAGLKLLGRWHKTDSSGGFALYEADNLAAIAANSAMWTDVLDTHDQLVIEDAEMAPVLAKVFGK